MIVKKTILWLLGLSDDKEKIGVARPEGPPLRGFRYPRLVCVDLKAIKRYYVNTHIYSQMHT